MIPARPSIRMTHDFERVAALPRRMLDVETANRWADVLTCELKDPACTDPEVALRSWQAMSLIEVLEYGGAWLALPVGFGKTLVSYLMATLLESERHLVIVPANMVNKTWHDFESYAGKWRAPPGPPKVQSKHAMQRDAYADLLHEYKPTSIFIDEGDECSNWDASVVARIDRYLHEHEGAPIPVCVASGTPGRLSILDYWHSLVWCLGGGAPVPLSRSEAQWWAAALDENSANPAKRPRPGPLGATRSAALSWYRRRLNETPGVIIVDGDSCDQPLTIRVRPTFECEYLDKAFRVFREDQLTPGGITPATPLEEYKDENHMGCGLYRQYVTPPPSEWLEARREFARFCRDAIRGSRESARVQRGTHRARVLDTEGQVVARYAGTPVVAEWLRLKPTFKPEIDVVWLTNATIRTAISWLTESPDPGILWCGSVDFARALAEATGLEYFGAKGVGTFGTPLYSFDTESAPTRSIIVSWNANKKGFNLHRFARGAVFLPPQSGKWLEQLIGRQHRSKQEQHVVFDLFATSGGTFDSFQAALREAGFGRASMGLTQKVLRADVQITPPGITESNQFRWASREKKEDR
jgi:hypothetical protein